MKKLDAYSVSIGALGALDTYLTATLILVPVWVTFIAWASFFILGGKSSGLKQSIASNLTGIAIASLTLLSISALGSNPLIAAICVGIGSAAMVQASKVPLLRAIPAIVWGFASTVGTTIATGKAITTPGLENPALVAAAAMILGGIFGYLSEMWGDAMTTQPISAREQSRV
ncbi:MULTISPECIES: DUF1097 domain-containing protein [Leptolyngbya]|uniref:DUF1097 domain-containing protein n=2 Tax=Leptolyngbya boryana TaxID=1184 RepID=A0A1Z4JNR5_LEPBY|nr:MULTISPECIES: DUF1097 domain-containing protein [Leptolyngbya]BAY58346.1 hypothetical protein NIES2135_52190 [Leptolyngbya boryana NIES-2135]MBD1857546.1 DUF1097 domain-containing protein [Leptolyngbya sp. FACHB-1624]MBD2368020.1 DUF1097 domain-containing protein [Leptolyngbya sp. FACHB-161]MBD2374544.1 DUF1097 domain-containing protein [Leptolyngbya sp. FACHB-238]MBD2398966.1 DUF1097 domain-containing protein [Leptolyngbya sp. FACHB-239]